MSKQTVSLSIKATSSQINWLKEYTRDLGYKNWTDYLEEAASAALFSPAEIAEIESQ